ncbi:MAG: Gfo/Idh/MocA family oxidoreductase [bacterium]|nr:Gfo/Idh/MocA family oxidoreductase [bacterium]
MKKLKIGILGCASIAYRMVIPALNSMEQYQVVAIASRTAEKAKQFAEKFNCEAITGYDNLLQREDIDAVYIPLPTGMHHEWTIKALKKGKHCLVEKPLTHDNKCTEEIVETARELKLSLYENFMFEYHSQLDYIKEKATSAEIGEIRCMKSAFGFPPLADTNIRYDKTMGGGALLDAGVYCLKGTQTILGKELTVQSAYLKIDPQREVDIYGGAMITNPQGAFSQVAFGFDNYYQCNVEIWGSKGKLTAHRIFSAGPGVRPKVTIEKQDEVHEYTLPGDNHFVNLLTDFYESIVKKEPHRQYERILRQAKLLQDVRDKAEKTT